MSGRSNYKNKGFTLVELLAIIVVLVFIALISVPIINNIITNSKKDAFEAKVEVALNNMEEYLVDNGFERFKRTGISVSELNKYAPNDFTNGKFIDNNGVIEAWYVTNGEFCAKGPLKDLKISKECYKLDDTGAEFDESKLYVTSTTRSVKVVIADGFAIDDESGIKKYKVSIVGGESVTSDTVGTFVFDRLKHDTEYVIKIEVTNGNNLTETFEKNVYTTKITAPVIAIANETKWKPSKVVTITGELNETELQYRVINGTGNNAVTKVDWTTINSGHQYTIDYTSNTAKPTYIYARITDGVNTVDAITKTQTMVDAEPPTIVSNGVVQRETSTLTIPILTADTGGSGINKVICEYGTTTNYGKSSETDDNVTATQTQCKITKLKKNTTYYYRIRVIDFAGNSSTKASSNKEITNEATTEEIVAPTIEITNELTWKPSKVATIEGSAKGAHLEYKVVHGSGNNISTVVDWTEIESGFKYTIDYTSNTDEPTYIYAKITDGTNTVDGITKTQTMVDADAPTIKANGSVAVETSTITIPILPEDTGGSGIDKTICEYGTSTSYGTSSANNAENITTTKTQCKITKLTKNTRYYYRIRTVDIAGNPSTDASSNKEVIGSATTADITAPTITIANENSWKPSKVVTITGSAVGANLQYKVVHGKDNNAETKVDWTTINSGHQYTINYTSNSNAPTYVYARITDGTNTVDGTTKTQTMVDSEAPTIQANGIGSSTTSTVTIPIITADTGGSGVANVTCEYGETNSYGKTANVSTSETQCKISKLDHNKTYYYRIRVTDAAGNSSTSASSNKEVTGSISTIVMPTPTITISDETTWKPSKTVTFNGQTAGAHLEYKVVNGTGNSTVTKVDWTEVNNGGTYTINYTSNSSKPTYVYLKITDGTNTVEGLTKTQTMVDPEAPTIQANGLASSTTSTITIPITVADTGGSGVDKTICEYGETNSYGTSSENNASNITTTKTECKITNLTKNKTYYYRIRVKDVAGNLSTSASSNKEVTGSASTDDMPTPTITIANETTWKPSKIVTFHGQASGAHLEYKVVNGTGNSEETKVDWTEINNGGTYTINYTSNSSKPTYVYLKITDGTNTVDGLTKTQTMVDAEPPTIRSNGNPTTQTSTITIPIISADTGGSGINNSLVTCEYGEDTNYGKTENVEVTTTQCKISKLKHNKTYYYRIRIKDIAGNSSTSASSNREVTGHTGTQTMCTPNISIANETTWKPSKVVTFTGSAAGANLQYKIVNGTGSSEVTKVDWTTIESGTNYTIDYTSNSTKPTYVYARCTDGTNTVDGTTKTQTMIDADAPTIEANGTASSETSTITIPIKVADTGGSGIDKVICEYGETNSYGLSSANNVSNITVSQSQCKITKLTKNKTYYYKVTTVDLAGNSSMSGSTKKSVTGSISTADIPVPTITIANENTWKPSKVVTFNGQATGAHLEYRIKNGNTWKVGGNNNEDSDWVDINNGGTYTINYTSNTSTPTEIYLRMTDGTNTVDGTTKTQTMVDANAPTIRANGTASAETSTITIPITVADTGGSGIGTVTCEYGETTSYGTSSDDNASNITVSQTQCKISKLTKNKQYYYRIRVKDVAGNSSTSASSNKEVTGGISTADMPTPTITITNENTWKPSKTVTFTGTAAGAHLEYRVKNGSTWKVGGNSGESSDWKEVNNGGTYTINYASNTSTPTEVYLRITDGTNTIDGTTKTQTMVDVDAPTIRTNGNATKETSTITIPIVTADTGGSGVGTVTCEYGEDTNYGTSSANGASNITVSQTQCKITGLTHNKTYYYRIRVSDVAGNLSTSASSNKEVTGNTKTEEMCTPQISITNENSWKPSKTVTITGSATGAYLQYKVVNGKDNEAVTKVNWTTIGSGTTYTINYTSNESKPTYVYAKCTDGTNTIDGTTKTQTKVDAEPPTIQANGNATSETSTITIPITVADTGGSGIDKVICEYGTSTSYGTSSANNASNITVSQSQCKITKLTKNQTYYYRVRVTDIAGNSSASASSNKEVTGSISTANMTTPTITITDENTWKPSKTVTFTGSAAGAHLEYRIKNGSTWKVGGNSGADSDWVTIANNGTYTINYASNTSTPTDVYLRITDGTNTVEATTKTQTKVDVAPPTIQANGSTSIETSTITIPITVADTGGSGVSEVICEYGETTSYGTSSANNAANITVSQSQCKITKLTMNKQYYYRIRVKDVAGNSSANASSNKEVTGGFTTANIPKPTITITNENAWKPSKVVTFTGTATGAHLEYRVKNGSTWKVGGNSGTSSDWVTINNGGTYTIDYASNTTTPTEVYLRMTDGTNTVDGTTKTQTMVDVEAPTIRANGTATKETSTITIPITVADTGGSGVGTVTCEYGTSTSYGTSSANNAANITVSQTQCKITKLTKNQTYYYRVRVSDVAGNPSTNASSNKEVTGSTATENMSTPTITISNENTWKPSKTVTFTGSANGAHLEYRIKNGSTWKVGGNSGADSDWVTIANNGTYTINYASNTTTPTEVYLRITDGTNTVEATTKTQTMVDVEAPTIRANGNPTKETSTITIPIVTTDTGGSGVGTVTCEYGENTNYGTSSANNAANITVSQTQCKITKLTHNKTYYYRIRVTDGAGNSSTSASSNKEVTGNTKTEEMCTPQISIANENSWKQSKVVTVTGSAAGANLQFKVVNGTTTKVNWSTISTGHTYTIDYTSNKSTPTYVYARCTDDTNTIDGTTKTQTWVDVTQPTCGSFSGGSINWATSRKISVACSDTSVGNGSIGTPSTNPQVTGDNSGCSKEKFDTTYSSTTITATPTITISDIAGNTTSCTSPSALNIYVDKTAPQVEANGSVTSSTSTISVPIKVTDDNSGWGSTTCEYGLTTSYGNTTAGTSTACNFSGLASNKTYYYRIRVADAVGNSSTNASSKKEVTGSFSTENMCTPNITIANETDWKNSKVVTFTGSATGAHIEYRVVNGTGNNAVVKKDWTTIANNGTYTIDYDSTKSTPTYVYAKCTDGTNTLNGTTKTQTWVDVTKPVCGSFSGGSTNWAKSRTINVACTDTAYGDGSIGTSSTTGDNSGCSQNSFGKGYTPSLGNYTQKAKPTITISDKAGNTKDCTAQSDQNVYAENVPPQVENDTTKSKVIETSKVTVPIKVTEAHSGWKSTTCQYKKSTESTWSTANTTGSETNCVFTKLTKNTTYNYKITVTDNLDISSTSATTKKEATGDFTTADMGKPTIAIANETDWKNSKVVTFTGTATGAHLEYKVVNGTGSSAVTKQDWTTIASAGTYTINYKSTPNVPTYVYLKITDGTNTIDAETKTQTMVDVDKPNCGSFSGGSNTWAKTRTIYVACSETATAETSGCSKEKFGKAYTPTLGNYVQTDTPKIVISDLAGNEKECTAPSAQNVYAENVAPQVEANGTVTTTTSTASVPIKVTEAHSGWKSTTCQYKLSTDSSWVTTNTTGTSTKCDFTKLTYGKVYNYKITVTDKLDISSTSASSKKTVEGNFTTVDMSIPTISIANENTWKPSKVVTFTGAATGAHLEYRIKNGDTWKVGGASSWVEIASGGTYTINYKSTTDVPTEVYLKITDGTNTREATTKTQTMVDVDPPSVATYAAKYGSNNAAYSSGTWTNSLVYTRISASDSDSKVAKIQYSTNKTTWTDLGLGRSGGVKTTGNDSYGDENWTVVQRDNTYYFRAVDTAGNVGEASSEFNIKYDKTAPTVELNGTVTSQTSTITVPVKVTDSHVKTIKSITCVAGESTSNYNSTGTGTVGTRSGSVTQGTCSFSGLKAGKTYYYKITATDTLDNTTSDTNALTGNFNTATMCTPTISITDETSWKKSKTVTFTGSATGANLQYKIVLGSTTLVDWTTIGSGSTYILDKDSLKLNNVSVGATTSTPAYIYARCKDDTTFNTVDANTKTQTMVDTVAPGCGTWTGASNTWAASRTVYVACSETTNNDNSGCSQDKFGKAYTTQTTTATPSITISDKVGNEAACSPSSALNIYVDKTAPTTGSGTAPGLSATTKSVTASVNQSDAHSGLGTIYYAIKKSGGSYGNWQSSTSTTYTFDNLDKNSTYYVKTKACDKVDPANCSGETPEANITTGNFTYPTISISDENSWKNSKTVTITGTTPTGTKIQFRIKNGDTWKVGGASSWVDYSSATTAQKTINYNSNKSTKTYVYARIYDGNNNNTEEAATKTQTWVDVTGPTCGSFSGGSTTWATSRTINVACTDTAAGDGSIGTPTNTLGDNSGCSKDSFGKDYTTHKKTDTPTISISDKAGNSVNCTAPSAQNIYVDKTAPTTTAPTCTVTTKSVTVTNKQTDADVQTLGTRYYAIKKSGGSYGSWQSNSSSSYTFGAGTTANPYLSKNTTYYVKTKACDSLGNCSGETGEVACTTTNIIAPTITIANESTWKKSKVATFTGTIPTGANLQYKIVLGTTTLVDWTNTTNGGTYTLDKDSLKLNNVSVGATNSTPAKVYLRIYDGNSSNTVDGTTKTQTMIDVTPPSCGSFSGGSNTWAASRTIYAACSETANNDNSGCLQDKFGKAYTTQTTTDTPTITISDNAENTASCTAPSAQNVYVDKTAPTTTAPELTATTKSVTATVKQADAHSGLGTIYYAIKKSGGSYGDWQSTTAKSFTFGAGTTANPYLSKNTTYYVKTKACDSVNPANCSGETSETSITTTNITAPTITIANESTWKKSKVVTFKGTVPTGANLQYKIVLGTTTLVDWTNTTNGGTYTLNKDSLKLNNASVGATTSTPAKVYLRIYDGNSSNTVEGTTKTQTMIDVTAPSCGSFSGGSTTWATSRTIYAACSETANNDNSGCSQDKFGKNYAPTAGNKVTTDTPTITISDNAENTASCTAPSAQNVYAEKIPPITTAPTCTVTTKSVTVTNKQTDADVQTLGTRYYAIKKSGGSYGSWQSNSSSTYTFGAGTTANPYLSKNTTYYVKTKACDSLGNCSGETSEVACTTTNITAPTISIANETTWKKSKVATFTGTIPTGANLQYKIVLGTTTLVDWTNTTNNGTYTLDKDSLKLNNTSVGATTSTPAKVYLRIYDGNSSNTVEGTTKTQTMIDVTPPSCGSFSGGSKTWAASRTIYAACSETANNDNSGCSQEKFGKPYTTQTTTDTPTITISDNASNTKDCTAPSAQNVYVDKTAPTTGSGTAPGLTATTKSVTATVKQADAHSGLGTIYYAIKKSGGSYGDWQSTTATTFTFGAGTTANPYLSKNTTYYVKTKACDSVNPANCSGETSETSITTTNITAPTISISDESTWKKSKVATFTGTIPTGANLQYKIVLGTTTLVDWTNTTNGGTYTLNKDSLKLNNASVGATNSTPAKVYLRIYDGNSSNTVEGTTKTQTMIDVTPPSCGSFSGASNTWATSRTIYVACSETANNDNSGCSQDKFGKNYAPTAGNKVTTDTPTITISDNAENTASCTAPSALNIYTEKIPPTTTAPTCTTTTKSVTVTNKQTDADVQTLGTRYYAIKKSGGSYGSWQSNSSNTYTFGAGTTANPYLSKNTTYYVKTKACDSLGNCSGETSEVSCKTGNITAPTIEIANETTWKNSKVVTFKGTVPTGANLQYKIVLGTTTLVDWTNTTNNGTYTLNKDTLKLNNVSVGATTSTPAYIYARIVDGNDSNKVEGNTKTQTKVDVTPPSCGSFSGASKTWAASRTLYAACSETANNDNSGCSQEKFGKPYTTQTTTATPTITISDNAENTASCTAPSAMNVYVDKTAPTDTTKPTLSASTKSITATCTQSDAHSGLGTIYYKIKKSGGSYGNWQNSTSTTYTFDNLDKNSTYYVKTKACDKVDPANCSGETPEANITTGNFTYPTISISDENSWKNSKTVTITGTTPTGTKIQFRIKNGSTWKVGGESSWVDYSSATTAQKTINYNSNKSAPTYVYARIYDGNNNNTEEAATKTQTWVDVTAPVCGSFSGATTANNWAASRTINVACTDTNAGDGSIGTPTNTLGDNSGCSQNSFSTTYNSTTVTTATPTISISDKAGNSVNCTAPSALNIYVDKTGPDETAPQVSMGTGRATITIKQTDAHVGTLANIKYGYSTSQNGTYTYQDSNVITGLSKGTTYYFKTQAKDSVGNGPVTSSAVTGTTGTQNTPTISFPDNNETAWKNSKKVKFSISTLPSNNKLQYRIKNGTTWKKADGTNAGNDSWIDTTNNYEFTIAYTSTTATPTEIYLRVIDNDNSSNVVNASTKTQIKIDVTKPTMKGAYAGTMLYTDPNFASGKNSIGVYNNSGGGTVTHERKSGTTPEGSYYLHIKTAGTASPGLGGFYFANASAANKVFVTRIVAKIPTGYTLNWHSNAIGSGSSNVWLTSQAGTGEWEEYINVTTCGSSGTFNSTNYFAISGAAGTASNPVEWDVAYATVIDTTKWGTTNYVISAAQDSESKIINYGLNQSSSSGTFGTAFTSKANAGKISSVTANGTYYAWYKDDAGNTDKQSATVSYVDRTGPTLALSGTPTMQAGTMTVSATATDTQVGTISSVTCKAGTSSSSLTITGTPTIGTKNGNATPISCYFSKLKAGTKYYYSIIATDSLGNTSATALTGNSDTSSCSAPSVSIENETSWKMSKKVTINAGTCSGGHLEYRVKNGSTWKVGGESSWVTISSGHQYTIDYESTVATPTEVYARMTDYTSDMQGVNVAEATTKTQTMIDRTKPNCGDWSGGSTTWNQSRTIYVACSETADNNHSGCAQDKFGKQYTTTTTTAKPTITISDLAGNEKECTASTNQNVYVDASAPTAASLTETHTTKSITVTASGTDSDSSIVRYQFSKNGGSNWEPSTPQTSATYTFNNLSTGTYSVKVKVINGTYAGLNAVNDNNSKISNATSVSLASVCNPSISITNENAWKNSKTVTISGDTPSGVEIQYKVVNGTGSNAVVKQDWTKYTGAFAIGYDSNKSKPTEISAKCTDGTNTGTTISKTQTWIDATAPTCGSFSGGTTANNWAASRTISVACTDTEAGDGSIGTPVSTPGDNSGCSSNSFSTTYNSSTITTATPTISINDKAGNAVSCTSQSALNIYVDKTKPGTTAPTCTTTTKSVTVTNNQADSHSGIKTRYYRIKESGGSYGSWQSTNASTTTYTFGAGTDANPYLKKNTTYVVQTKAIDNVNNESDETSTVNCTTGTFSKPTIGISDEDTWKNSKTVTFTGTGPSGSNLQYKIVLGTTTLVDWTNIASGGTYTLDKDTLKLNGTLVGATNSTPAYIYARIYDGNTNNTEEADSKTQTKIDVIAPSCGVWSGEGSSTTWAKTRTLSITCDEAASNDASGCSSASFNTNTINSGTVTTSDMTAVLSDNAGNQTRCTKVGAGIYVDTDAPTCPSAFTGWTTTYAKTRTIEAACDSTTESGSGCASSKFSTTIDSGTYTTGDVTITVKDNLKNSRTCTKNGNIYIDNTAPTSCSCSGFNSGWVCSNLTITASCTADANSGCGSNGTYTYTSGNNNSASVNINVQDKVGNIKTCTCTGHVHIDKTSYTITFSGKETRYRNRCTNVGTIPACPGRSTCKTMACWYYNGAQVAAGNAGAFKVAQNRTYTTSVSNYGAGKWDGNYCCNGSGSYVKSGFCLWSSSNYYWLNASGVKDTSKTYVWQNTNCNGSSTGGKWWFRQAGTCSGAWYAKSTSYVFCNGSKCKTFAFDGSGWCSTGNYACSW